MRDGRDFFQRHAESEVRLPRLVRVLLGVLVLLAAAGFVFLGAVLLPHRLQMPNPPHAIGTLLFGAFLVALGLGFGFVGMRLVLLKQHSEHLMSAHAARMASYCIAAVGALVIISSVFIGIEFIPTGLFVLLMAYWFHGTSKRVKQKCNEF
jgi:hypothetical protein